jgi:hypothetical protein
VAEPLSEIVYRQLAVYLGPHTARTAVRTFAQRALNKTPEELTPEDAAPLLEALHPMLRTLVGSDQSEAVLWRIQAELKR